MNNTMHWCYSRPFTCGVTEDLLGLGFDRIMIAGLVDAGLAEARSEIVMGPNRTKIEVVRIMISDAGRCALED
jgi:hypothetical protein